MSSLIHNTTTFGKKRIKKADGRLELMDKWDEKAQ